MFESLFNKVAGFQACNFIKKLLQYRWFNVNVGKFLTISILKNICVRGCFSLLTSIFNVSFQGYFASWVLWLISLIYTLHIQVRNKFTLRFYSLLLKKFNRQIYDIRFILKVWNCTYNIVNILQSNLPSWHLMYF